ncbi:MAG: class I SAM-dependent methyltransferase [Limisphaerales bacterium]
MNPPITASDPLFQPIACANCNSTREQHRLLIQTRVTHRGHLHGLPLHVVVCDRCGLTFLNPQPTPAALQRFYEREYYAGAKPISAEARMKEKDWQRTILLPWLLSHLPPVKNWAILDIGCGYGEWLRHFDRSNRLLGIEQSESAARAANERFGVEVRQCDFLANGYDAGHFDLVTGLAIIEHFSDPLAALVEVNRITRTGGFVYLQTPDLHALVLRKGVPRYFKLVHTYYYTLATLTSLLRKAGFEIVASRRRPAVLATSDSLRPGNFWAGELDVLARKTADVSLSAARAHPATGDAPEETPARLLAARTRDERYARLTAFYRVPVLGRLANHLIRVCYKLTGRSTKRIDFHAAQLEALAPEAGK